MANQLTKDLEKLISEKFFHQAMGQKFLERLGQGNLTRDENPESHFCVYFAAYDPKAKQIFIGHHKKSGLWLVNGGHIDQGETLQETLKREIDEEWGLAENLENLEISQPRLLTITEINNLPKQTCRAHYDVWYFVAVDKNVFNPDKQKLATEFHENQWVTFETARKSFIKDANNLQALDFMENNLI